MKLMPKNKKDRRNFDVVEEIRKRVAGDDTEPELNDTLNRVERKTTLILILIFLVGVLIAAAVILYVFLMPDPIDPDERNTTKNGTVRPVNDLCMNAIDLSEAFDTVPPGRGYGGFYLAPTNGTTVGATPDEDCRGFKNAKGVWYVLDNHWYDHVDACDAFDQ